MIYFLPDEIQLEKELTGPSNTAAADPSRDVSFETMIFGLLTKQILPDATVLGFSRSGSFVNSEFLNGKSEVYSIQELSWEDVQTFIEKTTEDKELREQIRKQFEKIDKSLREDILFMKQVVKIAHEGKFQLGEITSNTDLFLAIILGNLSHQAPNRRSGYSELSETEKNNLKSVFELCKENLQRGKKGTAGDFKGTKMGGESWQCDETEREIPLTFLTSVGIFEIPSPDFGEVTLTANHLSFIEFFAAAGILLSSDIKSELEKIENKERFKAVTLYIR